VTATPGRSNTVAVGRRLGVAKERAALAAFGLVALVAMVAVVPVVAAAPAAAASGVCTNNVDVTIVVDFQGLGAGVSVVCAPGPVSSGLDAFDRAGVTWEGTQRFPGLVCRIAGQPTASTEACVNAPPPTAYWSYWIAPRGGSWCYSSLGAGNRTPPPGSVEGWSFSLGGSGGSPPTPRYAPPPPIPGTTPNPLRGGDCSSPPSSPPPATAPPATSPAVGGGGGPGSSPAAAHSADPAAAAGGAGATTVPGAGINPAAPTGGGAGAPPATDGQSTNPSAGSGASNSADRGQFALNAVDLTTSGRHGAGTPVGLIATIGVLAVLAAAATVVLRRRRSIEAASTGDETT
jgi:hypothetical protein